MVAAIRSIPDTVPADDRTIGWSALEWSAEYLLQPDGPEAGEAWRFTDEQVRIVLRWYAIDERGRFVFRRGQLRRMKGWGKDPFAAALAAIELCGPCRFGGWDARRLPVAVRHPAAWIQTAAVSKDQTRNTMTLFPGMMSPKLLDEFGVDLGKEIIHTRSGGRIEAVTSSPRALEGGRPSFTIANESHHWLLSNEGLEMMAAIRRNARKSRDGSSRVLEITNAHLPGEGSVAEGTFEGIQKAGGQIEGVYFDSVEAPFLTRENDKGEVEVVPIEDMTDEQIEANLIACRADSTWLDVEGIRAEIRDPTSEEGKSRRFYFNQVYRAEAEGWFAPGVWPAKLDERPVPDGADVVLALDGSFNGDSTGVVVVEVDPLHVDVAYLDERPADAGPGWQVDILAVEEAVRAACKRWNVLEVVCDPYRWQHSMAAWADEGIVVVEFPQSGARMVPATQKFEQLIKAKDRLLTHAGNPDLTRHVGNSVVTEDNRGRRVRKVSKWSKLYIDLAVASIMGVDRASQVEAGGVPNVW